MNIKGINKLVSIPIKGDKIIAENIGVDAGMIMVADLSYLETCPSPDVSKLYRLGEAYEVPNGKYMISWKIKETWHGKISGEKEINITSGKLIIVDPCYVIGQAKHDDWIKWLKDNLSDKNNPNSDIVPQSDKAFIIQEMGGDGCYKVELKLKKI